MKKVLITGINGAIGSTIARHLYGKYEISGTSLEDSNLTGIPITYFKSDISKRDSLEAFPKEIDIIVHCAAAINYDNFSSSLIDANCKGTQNIALYANTIGCSQLIYFSSLPVIGKPLFSPITEDHPINPPTVYHISKYFGELLFKTVLKNVALTVFRIPSPIGYGMPLNKIVPVFVQNAIENRDFVLKGSGSRIQNYIDVRDIARAVDCAIEKKAEGIFNIASDKSYSNKEIAELCISHFSSTATIRYEGVDLEEDNRWIVSTQKAKQQLAFCAIFSISDTLNEIAKQIKERNENTVH